MKKRERVLSACGMRNQYVCKLLNYLGESPRIAVHKKDESTPNIVPPSSCRPTKKDDASLPNARLPPRPIGLPNCIYKLPPKPSYHLPNGNNKSSEASQRDSSKENLKNVGARIVNDVKPVMTPRR